MSPETKSPSPLAEAFETAIKRAIKDVIDDIPHINKGPLTEVIGALYPTLHVEEKELLFRLDSGDWNDGRDWRLSELIDEKIESIGVYDDQEREALTLTMMADALDAEAAKVRNAANQLRSNS
jgi:hypothetical protein